MKEQTTLKLSTLSKTFIEKNNNNKEEVFKKWKWDAIINAIELKKIDKNYLIKNKYI